MAHNKPTTSHSWFNIDMVSKTVVHTVLIINTENTSYIGGISHQNDVEGRIKGSDLYVGDNSLPYQNTPCGANPQSSGVYSCGGKIGRYLGIYKKVQYYLNISQIRAYSYTQNAYPIHEYKTSLIDRCETNTNLAFLLSRILTFTCNMPLAAY